MTIRTTSLSFLACVAATRVACADVSPDAARVIARYLEATGGTAAAAAEHSTYTHARVEGFGFSGTTETWNVGPDRQYSRTELGPFKLEEGTDGAVSWRTDPTTGRVTRLADRDSVEARVGVWFELERWADPDAGGGHLELAGHERDSLGAYTVLAVSAPDEGDLKPRRLWFSDATGLLAREEAQHDQSQIVTTYSDWRLAAGRQRPFVTATVTPMMPANQLRTLADSFAVNVDVSHVPFAAPGGGGGNALAWKKTPGEAVLPFEYRARHLWLKASIDGGPPQDFLFDTGASITVLDSAFAAAHGLHAQGQMQAAGAGASGTASFTTIGSLAVQSGDDGVELRDLKVAVMSVNPTFSRFFWRDMAGVLGYDFISRFVVTVDYDKGVLTLHDPKTFTAPATGAALPMVLNGIVPAVKATLDGKYDGLFRLDLGSSSTVDLHAPFAQRNGLEKRLRDTRPVTGAGFGGQFESTLGRMHTMAIGPYRWSDPMVSISHATEGAFASEDFAGNIGNRILERFKVTLDYDQRRIWLEPGARYTARDEFTHTGLLLTREGDRVLAESVLSGSPAERAGVREGDELLAIDGRAASQWTPQALDDLFERDAEGRRVALRLSRDGKERAATMTLHEMLR
ncbi:MAG TPA: aspartyl protease family protein [Candidatus Acidoferrales bacterium]|nr:aspartyl protease family protein [Candidatus Acidoferrales bacterium]